MISLAAARRVPTLLYYETASTLEFTPTVYVDLGDALERLGVAARDAMFVGDQVDKDVRGARGVGMPAIRVRSGEHAGCYRDLPGVLVVDTAIEAIELVLRATAVWPTGA